MQDNAEIDSSGSFALLLLIGSMASFICGLLNFGQGMSFAVLWNAARCMKLLDSNASFSKGIAYGQILSFFALIPVVIAGWREVLKLIGYSSIMLALMNHVRHNKLHNYLNYLSSL
jgi:hypothetical protein